MKSDADVPRILKMDGVDKFCLDQANKEIVSIPELIKLNGRESSWSHTIINTPSNSATLICQLPGEGNRMHHHPDWDEWWYIIEGSWEWDIEGMIKTISQNEIVFIEPSAAIAEEALDCSRSRLKQKQLSVTKGRENDSEPPEPVGAFPL